MELETSIFLVKLNIPWHAETINILIKPKVKNVQYFSLYKFQWGCFGKANLNGNINPQHPQSPSL